MLRTPLKRNTPLKRKRDKPRRASPKRKPGKSAVDRQYHEDIAKMPCEGCGRWPVEVHHVIGDGFKRLTKDHRLVLPLCPACHRTRRWNERHGFAQHERAQQLWEEFDG